MKFEGYHKNFQLEEGELFFPDGERHEGIWTNNIPGKDGIRKFKNGGRSKGPIYSIQLSKGLHIYRVIFKSTGDNRIYEIWNGNKNIRESVEGVLPKESLDLELNFLNACAKGDLNEVIRILEIAPLLSRFAYEIYMENNVVHLNPALLLTVERNHHLVLKHLLEFGADITVVDQNMQNAFHTATKDGNYDVLEILCSATNGYEDMDIHPMDFRDKGGSTPLALGWDLYLDGLKKRLIDEDKALEKCIRILMRYGADPGDTISSRHQEIGVGWMNVFSSPKIETIVHRYDREYKKIAKNLPTKKKRALAQQAAIWYQLGL